MIENVISEHKADKDATHKRESSQSNKFLESLSMFSDDFMENGREQELEQERESL